MEMIARSFLLSWMLGMSCKLYFEALAPMRRKSFWMKHTVLWAFTAAFLVIAFTEIPPYILQPVRVIVFVALVAQIYYQIGLRRNLVMSLLFCGIFWLVSLLTVSVVYAFVTNRTEDVNNLMEPVSICIHLCMIFVFRYRWKDSTSRLMRVKWPWLALFPLCSMIVMVAFSMIDWGGSAKDNSVRLAAVSGFAALLVCVFYFLGNLLEAEEKLQELRLSKERIQNQMLLYRSIQEKYEQQRRYLHDYKNQLQCISGMLDRGDSKEALAYISQLTGSIKKSGDYVNTNHGVVNVVLNQKYQEAVEKGITITMAVNDLSALAMKEEAIVVLLVNLLDNALEACEKLEGDKMIQFKMMLEEDQLILSVRNPVREKVRIRGKRIETSKQDTALHGIGLRNIDAVIQENKGTSVVTCEDGWFYFSAMLPVSLK